MKNEIKYIKQKEYTYVLSKNYNQQLDISIFEVDEWLKLLEISFIYEKALSNLNYETDDMYRRIDKNVKDSIYYLYFSPFCHYEGFNKLEYETIKIEDIHELVFDRVRYQTLTINEFRKWVAENYDSIVIHHENILKTYYL